MNGKKWIVGVGVLTLVVAWVQAVVIASEEFVYEDGVLAGRDGGFGWVDAWNAGTKAIEVSGEQAAITGGASSNRRTFEAQYVDCFYSVDMSMSGGEKSHTVLARIDYNNHVLVAFGIQNGRYYLQVGGNPNHKVKGGFYADGERVQLVVGVAVNGNGDHEVAKLWVNPSGPDAVPLLVLDSVEADVAGGKRIQIQTLGLKDGSGTATWDNLVVATEFSDIVSDRMVLLGSYLGRRQAPLARFGR